MCLTTYKPPVVEVAAEEMPCYKVIRSAFKARNSNESKTPDQLFSGYVGRAYNIPYDEKWTITSTDSKKDIKKYFVHGGGFHLFQCLDEAQREAKMLNEDRGVKDHEVILAIVPKGTEYIRGFYFSDSCIAVRTVKYKKMPKNYVPDYEKPRKNQDRGFRDDLL